MADTPISQLPIAEDAADVELVGIQGGVTKRIAADLLQSAEDHPDPVLIFENALI